MFRLLTGIACGMAGAAFAVIFIYLASNRKEQKKTRSQKTVSECVKPAMAEQFKTEMDAARYFIQQLELGDKAIMAGREQKAVAHYVNAFYVGRNATALMLDTMRHSTPPRVFAKLIDKLSKDKSISICARFPRSQLPIMENADAPEDPPEE